MGLKMKFAATILEPIDNEMRLIDVAHLRPRKLRGVTGM